MQPGYQLRTTSEQYHFTPYTGYHYIKYQLPTGPMCPSSHDLAWLSKPLIPLIYSTLTDTYTNPRACILPSHRPHVTLVLLYHPCVMPTLPPSTIITFS